MFRAWQSMNNPQEQQRRNFTQPPPQPAPPPGTQPQPSRPGPPPPPRNKPDKPDMPTEEQIRAGMKYKNAPPNVPPFSTDGAAKNQTAWQAFQKSNANKPGMNRSTSTRTPKKGFNPNTPGSDEKAYMGRNSHYVHRNKSADFGGGTPGVKVPPPPPGPPPAGTPTTPISPVSPTSQRPAADPTRPFSSHVPDDQVPFTEDNRHRTPYTSFIGEKFDFGEGLRRSHSHRDTTKLGPEEAANKGRARSVSPLPKQRASDSQAQRNGSKTTFSMDNSSNTSDSDRDMTSTPDESNETPDHPQRPGTAPIATGPFGRPKKVPTPPSSRFNGTHSGPTSPPPPVPEMPSQTNGATTDGTHPDSDQPGMEQKHSSANMYVTPSFSSSSSESWKARMFGSHSTLRARCARAKIPQWAIPSSINPTLRTPTAAASGALLSNPYVTAADTVFVNATKDEKSAFYRFQTELQEHYGYVPNNLDMEGFLKLASTARCGVSSGHQTVDVILRRVLLDFASVGHPQNHITDEQLRANSFTMPINDETFTRTNTNNSEDNINTSFSAEGWNGGFTSPSYFAPPPSAGRKQRSPSRRATSSRSGKEPHRSSTMDEPSTNTPQEEVPQRAWGSAGTPLDQPRYAATLDSGFDEDQWKKDLADGSWTWQGTSRPKSARGTAPGLCSKQNRRPTRNTNKGVASARAPSNLPPFVDEDDTLEPEGADGQPEHGAPVMDDGDAMDIDNTPPAHQNEAQANAMPTQTAEKEARLYGVHSNWRQQHGQRQKQANGHRKSASASQSAQRAFGMDGAKLNSNLDDLRNVEPFKKDTEGSVGLGDLSGIASTLPFESQAESALPTQFFDPQKLNVPKVPIPPPEPGRLSKASWQQYAKLFGTYLQAFHGWNGEILNFFNDREKTAEAQLMQGIGWLEASGDTVGSQNVPKGFGSYLQAVKENEGMREGWTMGCDKHAEAVKGFEKMREQVRRRAQGGTLPEN